MTTHRVSKSSILSRDRGLIAGFPKRLASQEVLVDGTSYTASAAVALLQKRVTARTAVVTARAAYEAAVKAANAEYAATAATVSGFVSAIYVAFGEDPAALADFGLPARKKGVLTPEQQEVAIAKRAATRAARHTMGPKQKAKITGQTVAAEARAAASAAP